MELALSNSWGLLGLLAIPVIIAIHFLQRRSRSYIVSTLFLVPVNSMQARSGSRFQFWRNSASFWMQLLAALLLTWILAQPRWVAADFRQRVVIIYDSSVSMQAFDSEVEEGLRDIVDRVGRLSQRTEWVLLPSDAREGLLYRGVEAADFLGAALSYQPEAGKHSLEAAFRMAAQLDAEGQQRVILLTDHIPESVPGSVELFAVGHSVPNVGFSGLRVESRDGVPVWRASVRNYEDQPVHLNWQLKVGDQAPVQATLDLAARGTKVLTSGFPQEADLAVTLQLPDDAFALDNQIMILQPTRKEVKHVLSASSDFVDQFSPIINSVTQATLKTDAEDAHFLWVAGSEKGLSFEGVPYTVQFAAQDAENLSRVQGFYTVERDPLMDGLNWNSLVYSPLSESISLRENERVLLWHDQQPLISIRERAIGRDLYFNFDPLRSNALQLPGFLILINRFVTDGEATLPLAYRANFEGNQSLGFERLQLEREDRLELFDRSVSDEGRAIVHGHIERAPVTATRLVATLNDAPLLEASVFFAETTEADFSNAASVNTLTEKNRALVENNSREDFLTPVWLFLLVTVLLLNWYFCSKGR